MNFLTSFDFFFHLRDLLVCRPTRRSILIMRWEGDCLEIWVCRYVIYVCTYLMYNYICRLPIPIRNQSVLNARDIFSLAIFST